MSSKSWIAGECKKCGYEVVVTQPDSENYPYDDYWWYCSNKDCSFHKQGEHTGDMEVPTWIEIEKENKITIELDKEDMTALVKGLHLPLELMDEKIISENGNYAASYGRWDWKWNAFQKNSLEEIYQVYLMLKNYQEDKNN
ncbi:hypothetical protein [Orenia marismortui]|uniref:Uncharacterized protein n=1 Tax=Orenia marismortui TaxID=46469 RepID=A0A4R8GTV6_9FIRM|nr:hypothetical protein [Orenia marismortui]TDX48284.1 hypothetical protein C7959_13011 [Orenia marismortui]